MAQLVLSINSIENINRQHLALVVDIGIESLNSDTLIFKRQNEIIFGSLLHEEEVDNILNGIGFFLYTDTFDLIKEVRSAISVGDIVYFNKRGKLKFTYLEGVENPKIFNRRINKYIDNRINTFEEIRLPPNEKRAITVYAYIGKKEFVPNNLKYIRFYYKRDNEVSYTDYYSIR